MAGESVCLERGEFVQRVAELLPEHLRTKLRSNGLAVPAVLGSSATTFAIGGAFEAFLEVEDPKDLPLVCKSMHASRMSLRVIGAGSNVLCSSGGVPGLTIRLGRGFRYLRADGDSRVRVGASYSLMALSRELSSQGLSGLEFAGGIPASIGGAVVMNAGAHGGQIADVIERVVVVLPDGSIEDLSAASLKFSYRHSELPPGATVSEVLVSAVTGDKERSAKLRQKCLDERKARQPLQSPSAGSVFRNPSPEQSAGWFIEQAGLKGAQEGGARISSLHANWIVNESRTATDSDVAALIERCRSAVMSQSGVSLVPEIIHWR